MSSKDLSWPLDVINRYFRRQYFRVFILEAYVLISQFYSISNYMKFESLNSAMLSLSNYHIWDSLFEARNNKMLDYNIRENNNEYIHYGRYLKHVDYESNR